MNLRLVSDFRDFYDVMFDRTGETFRRVTTDGPTRVEMFALLHGHGLATPPCGVPASLRGITDQVVVHTDLAAHAGEGKVLLPITDAIEQHPTDFAVAYVAPRGPAESLRLLLIGSRSFAIRYVSAHDWRSNVGEGDVGMHPVPFPSDLVSATRALQTKLRAPLLAIDFVARGPQLFALDINVAPQLNGTGVQSEVSASQVVDLLREWHTMNQTPFKEHPHDRV